MSWFSPQTEREIIVRYTQNKESLSSLAVLFNSSIDTIRNVLLKHAVEPRSRKEANSRKPRMHQVSRRNR
jgi:predicted RNA binding protein with dsRBD fold (UPF0201 family)